MIEPHEFTKDEKTNYKRVWEQFANAPNLPSRQTRRAAAREIARRMAIEARGKQ